MTEATKVPAKVEGKSMTPAPWHPMETLRREVDRLFEDFGVPGLRRVRRSLLEDPFFRRPMPAGMSPAVDIVEKDKAYEVTADVPGFDEKNIEVKVVNGSLSIKGERQAEKEEKKKDYYLSEREFGSFERSFPLPEGVDREKIEATVKKGILTVTLPKTPEACTPAKKIEVKAGS
ncbi:MAG: Hsp20/alpha crystallin family protein [Proteobacteria bacterium]|nr:Hsp20/alpha crystallin family protein [Pseudomonadota bacterium]